MIGPYRIRELSFNESVIRANTIKRKRYSVEQIIAAVNLLEAGESVAEICRKLVIAEGVFLSL